MYRGTGFSEFPVYIAYKIQLLLHADYSGASPIAIAGSCQELFTVFATPTQHERNIIIACFAY